MIVFSVMYPNEPGSRFDMDYYCTTHIPLVKEKVGDALKSVSVERGMSGGEPRLARELRYRLPPAVRQHRGPGDLHGAPQ